MTSLFHNAPKTNPWWASLPDDELLDVRLCDLELALADTAMMPGVEQLYGELDRRGFAFKPHVWISTEWFSPDGVPGIALPFFLMHPRLAKLEHRMMGEAEGNTRREFMKLLRHEMGHVVCTAHRIHYKPSFRALFGRYGIPYPDSYTANPKSRDFVHHLDWWYAQSHPAEDFAETFAVWLTPGSPWRRRYQGWGALRKLEFVNEQMRSLRALPPKVTCRDRIDALADCTTTLRRHYARRRRQEASNQVAKDLKTVFTKAETGVSAASFLMREHRRIRSESATLSGHPEYSMERVLQDAIEDCRRHGLRLAVPERRAVKLTVQMLCDRARRYRRRRIAL